ncbi:hypothetical protein NIT60_14135 [Mammaliicoccus sciuri]|nr:hypothetical protein NIT60_14135 [Mammaliicoccus sciuri]
MVQKKKPATRKRKTTRGKKKQKDNTLKYVIQMIVLFLLVLGIFQLGFIGLMIDRLLSFLIWILKIFHLYTDSDYFTINNSERQIKIHKKSKRIARLSSSIAIHYAVSIIFQRSIV